MTPEQQRTFKDLAYCPESGVFTWTANGRGQTKRVGSVAGAPSANGYVRIKVGGKTYYAHRLAWLFVYGVWPANQVDHINRTRSDNRMCNLRAATSAQNRRNSDGIPCRRKSKYKGVRRGPRDRKWTAQITADGITQVIGRYETEEEAAQAYREAADLIHGEYAHASQ